MEKIDYDKEEDILTFSKGRKIKSSMDIGEFIIDIDHEGFIAGIEILNASNNLNVSSEKISKLKEVSMKTTYKPNSVYVSLILKFEGQEKDITIPLALDLGHGKTTTEKVKFAVA